jgi:hypothetical protein
MAQRYTIAYEGIETSDGRSLAPGKLELPTEPIPVTILPDGSESPEIRAGHVGSKIYGRASDIRREDDGRITAELDREPPDWASPEIEIDMAEFDGEPGKVVVTSGRLRAVTLGEHPAWPALAERARP